MLYENIVAWIMGQEKLKPFTLRFLKKHFKRLTSEELMKIRSMKIL